MISTPTHRVVKSPKVNGRYLSDYMDASERKRRTIIRDCKYRVIAKLLQHDRAKAFITNFLKNPSPTKEMLSDEATRLHEMMADTKFDRDLLDVNGDFLAAYAEVFTDDSLPAAEIEDAPSNFKLNLNGVEVNPDIRLALQRTNKNNRQRTGLLTIRYAKGKPLAEEVGLWQSSLLFACRQMIDEYDEAEAEQRLCLTLDAVTGRMIAAPTNAISRFKNMEAACASIAERWDSIEPPENAVF